ARKLPGYHEGGCARCGKQDRSADSDRLHFVSRMGQHCRRYPVATRPRPIAALPVGGRIKPFAESVLYRKINNALAYAPGAVASRLPNEEAYYDDIDQAIVDWNVQEHFDTAEFHWMYWMGGIILKQEKFERLRVA